MFGHRAEHVVVRGGVAEAECGVLRFAATDDFDRANAEELHDAAQLVDGERIVEIFTDRQLDSGVADELQRRAALAAAWVVEEDVSHWRRIHARSLDSVARAGGLEDATRRLSSEDSQ